VKLAEMRRQIRTMRKTETDHLLEEGLFRTLENSSQAGTMCAGGEFRFVNTHAAFYWGYSKDELIGMESMSLVYPDDRERVRRSAIDMLKGKRTSSYEFRTMARMAVSAGLPKPLPQSVQGKRAVLGNSMDITEQIKARTKLAELEALEPLFWRPFLMPSSAFATGRIIFANDGVREVFAGRPKI